MSDHRKQSPELERIRDMPPEPAWSPDDIEDQPEPEDESDPLFEDADDAPEENPERDQANHERRAYGLVMSLQNTLMGLKLANQFTNEELPGVDLTVIHEVQEGLRQLVRDLQAKYPL
jgi:hypothetical protein